MQQSLTVRLRSGGLWEVLHCLALCASLPPSLPPLPLPASWAELGRGTARVPAVPGACPAALDLLSRCAPCAARSVPRWPLQARPLPLLSAALRALRVGCSRPSRLWQRFGPPVAARACGQRARGPLASAGRTVAPCGSPLRL